MAFRHLPDRSSEIERERERERGFKVLQEKGQTSNYFDLARSENLVTTPTVKCSLLILVLPEVFFVLRNDTRTNFTFAFSFPSRTVCREWCKICLFSSLQRLFGLQFQFEFLLQIFYYNLVVSIEDHTVSTYPISPCSARDCTVTHSL